MNCILQATFISVFSACHLTPWALVSEAEHAFAPSAKHSVSPVHRRLLFPSVCAHFPFRVKLVNLLAMEMSLARFYFPGSLLEPFWWIGITLTSTSLLGTGLFVKTAYTCWPQQFHPWLASELAGGHHLVLVIYRLLVCWLDAEHHVYHYLI